MMILSTHLSTGGVNLPAARRARSRLHRAPRRSGARHADQRDPAFNRGLGKSYVRFFYPFVPFTEFNASGEAVLEKVVDGAVVARGALKMANNEKLVNTLGDLKLSVRADRIAVWRAGTELFALEDRAASRSSSSRPVSPRRCWHAAFRGFRVEDAAGKVLWDDDLHHDTSARYQWQITPAGGLNAMWLWGWYAGAPDAYRFLPARWAPERPPTPPPPSAPR